MDNLHCSIRKSLVSATPEEIVRQKMLQLLMSLGYPESGFVVEHALQSLPHLQTVPKNQIPRRRADILFFAKDIHPQYALYPLLLIECKAVKLTSAAINQAFSYNYYIQAYAVAVANATECKLGARDAEGQYRFLEGFPRFEQLLQLVR